MLKFRMLFDKDAEWLNSMAQNGWAMTGFFEGFYIFNPCEKGAYQYQIDFTARLFSSVTSTENSCRKWGLRSSQTGDSGLFCANLRTKGHLNCIRTWIPR